MTDEETRYLNRIGSWAGDKRPVRWWLLSEAMRMEDYAAYGTPFEHEQEAARIAALAMRTAAREKDCEK